MRRPDDPDTTMQGERDLLLFLCVANVCRSPAMHFLVQRGLEERGLGRSWQLASAGTAVSERQQMCAGSAAYISTRPGGDEFARTHRSQPVNRELIERAGLILVTTQRERAVVVRQFREARERTFTMIEAALLAATTASRLQVSVTGGLPEADPVSLEQLVEAINRSRGHLLTQSSTRPSRGRLSRQRGLGDFDIGDVHSNTVRRRHAPVLADLAWASEQLTEALGAIAGHDPGRLRA